MCGISGALALASKSVNVANCKCMADSIEHRGPDDAGYLFLHTGCRHHQKISFKFNLTDTNFHHLSPLLPPIESQDAKQRLHSHDWDLFMGHRRLAILDPSPAGHQPMCDLSENVWLTFNGEIYNFKELRQTLKSKGHHFFTQTDTEVIIYAYIEWGLNCIEKFNGMFAFALYDNHKQKLYLVRDRYGIKPLYYSVNGSTNNDKRSLLFASEAKSILQYQNSHCQLDCEALLEYMTFQNIFSQKTFYKGIHLLSPGHYIEIDLNDTSTFTKTEQIPTTQYWDFNFQEENSTNDSREFLEELHRLFEQAVGRQLISDVEIGSYLSGGMDSGSISCIASKKYSDLKTFTVGFDMNSVSGMELAYDERSASEYLSYLFKTEHYEMVLKSGDMERCLPQFAWHMEEPRVGQSYPNYYAAKLAGNFVNVVLSGTGGDELFGGYPWRYYRAVKNNNFDHYIDKYYLFWQRLVRNKDLKKLFSPIWNQVSHIWTRNIFKEVFPNHIRLPQTPEEYINHSLYFECKTFLHGLLVMEDKLSMAFSLESRVPFLDNDLVDFAMKLPVSLKLGGLQDIIKMDENEFGRKKEKYFSKSKDGKLILRQMMEAYIPQKITSAAKQGFFFP